MIDYWTRRLFVWAAVATPLGALAQTTGGTGLPAGLDKPKQIMTDVQQLCLAVGVIFISIALIGCGIGMAHYKKRWEDLAMPVMGGIVVGIAVPLAAFLVG